MEKGRGRSNVICGGVVNKRGISTLRPMSLSKREKTSAPGGFKKKKKNESHCLGRRMGGNFPRRAEQASVTSYLREQLVNLADK